MRQLRGRKEEDRRRDDCTGAPDRLVGDPDLGAVGHEDDDAVSGLDATCAEASRQPRGPFVQLGGTKPAAVEPERLVVAEPLERLLRRACEVMVHRDQRPYAAWRRRSTVSSVTAESRITPVVISLIESG